MSHPRHLPLPGSFNIRDLGGYDTPSGKTAPRLFLRADSLHRLSPESLDRLTDLGLGTVIDLRHDTERRACPNPFATPREGVAYHAVPLFENLDPARAGIQDAPDLLLALYKVALAERGAAFGRVFTIMAEAPGALLFHCTAGKDRTGMVAALLLLLAGVADDDIVRDYALTGDFMAGMITRIVEEAAARGDDIAAGSPLLRSDPGTMRAFLDHLREAFGSAEAYLALNGLPAEALETLRARLAGAVRTKGEA